MCRQILVKITNVKYHENRPIGVALIHADGRAEEAKSYFRKRMLLNASMLNRLIVTEPKNLILSSVVSFGKEKQSKILEFGFQVYQFLQYSASLKVEGGLFQHLLEPAVYIYIYIYIYIHTYIHMRAET